MTESARFVALSTRVDELRRILLPDPFDPTGTYPSEQLTRTFGFRLLCHAEIESYLEERAEEIAKAALHAWVQTGSVSRVLVSLVCFSGLQSELPPGSLNPPQPSQRKTWPSKLELDERVREGVTAFVRDIRNNHGIKEENLLRLLVPIGTPVATLDPAFLADCNSFGAARGETAHLSASRVSTVPDPKTEYETVLRLVAGLRGVDAELSLLHAGIWVGGRTPTLPW